jgi:hypothetical protein
MRYVLEYVAILAAAISFTAAETVTAEVAKCTPATYDCYQNGTWTIRVCDVQGIWQLQSTCGPDQTCKLDGGSGYCV